jgi:peroxiredoxin Q/BCP
MAQLRQDYQNFTDRGTAIIAVGPENAEAFAEFWHSRDMPFTGIPDPNHAIAKLYGQQVDIFKLGRMPAMFIIDKEGKIRFQHYGNSMSDIPKDKDILALLDDLNKGKKIGAEL